MKQQVFYIHGGNSFSDYDRFLAYLKKMPIRDLPGTAHSEKWGSALGEMLGDDFEVFTPKMPNAQNAKYEEWKIWFERHFEYVHDDVVLIGWSLGGFFLAKYLVENEAPFSIKTLLLVAPLFTNVPDEPDGEDCSDFAYDTTQVQHMAQQVPDIHIFHSKDDLVVSYEHALRYQEALVQAQLHTFEDRNHFLQADFPELTALLRGIS